MIVLLMLLAHWVGDYVLQTNDMAQKKGVSFYWLTVHVAVYTAALACFSIFLLPASAVVSYVLLNGGLHWLTDLVTSRVAPRFSDRPRIFYPIIGFDQLIHAVTLIATLPGFSF